MREYIRRKRFMLFMRLRQWLPLVAAPEDRDFARCINILGNSTIKGLVTAEIAKRDAADAGLQT
jgi:hypothetical protein